MLIGSITMYTVSVHRVSDTSAALRGGDAAHRHVNANRGAAEMPLRGSLSLPLATLLGFLNALAEQFKFQVPSTSVEIQKLDVVGW